jgi:hypothetical protein
MQGACSARRFLFAVLREPQCMGHPARDRNYPRSATRCMIDLALHRVDIQPPLRISLYRAPRTEDGQPVPAGLLTCGSNVRSNLPDVSIVRPSVVCVE